MSFFFLISFGVSTALASAVDSSKSLVKEDSGFVGSGNTEISVEAAKSLRFYSENIAGLRDPNWVHSHQLQYRKSFYDSNLVVGRLLAHLEYQDFWKSGQSGQAILGAGAEFQFPNLSRSVVLQAQVQNVTSISSNSTNLYRSKVGIIANWYQDFGSFAADEYFELFHFRSNQSAVGGTGFIRGYKRLWLMANRLAFDPLAFELRRSSGDNANYFGASITALSAGPRIYFQLSPEIYFQAHCFYGVRSLLSSGSTTSSESAENFWWGALVFGGEW